jgi:hypothetical protein
MSDTPLSPSTQKLNSITKTIYCQRSGVVLGTLQVLILEGHIPYLHSHAESIYLHPFYNMDAVVLLKKLEDGIRQAQETAWILTELESRRIKLLMSALLWKMDCIKQDRPTLPPTEVAVGSADRVYKLAKWYFDISSQRLKFPIYSISALNQNLTWANFRIWIGEAFQVKHSWAHHSRELAAEAKKRILEEAMKDIVSEPMKRVDQRKVWNWIETQLSPYVDKGRITTFKELFIEGDINYTDWYVDDVEDLEFEILQHCDVEYHIMPYIRKRLKGIKGLIQDLMSGFTLLTKHAQDQFGGQGLTDKEAAIFDDYDRRAAALETLPPEPQRGSFETTGKYMKALAEWRILSRRFDEKVKRQVAAPKVKDSQDGDDSSLDVEDL